eukprot:4565844-Prorocentrum_lima.AAC.1
MCIRDRTSLWRARSCDRARPKDSAGAKRTSGSLLYSKSWTNKVTYVLVKDHEGSKLVKHGLEPTLLDQQSHTP